MLTVLNKRKGYNKFLVETSQPATRTCENFHTNVNWYGLLIVLSDELRVK